MSDVQLIGLPVRARPLPAPDTLSCWLVDVSDLALALPVGGSDHRAERRSLRFQRQFLLRLVLGAYLDRPGKDVVLQRQTSGKLALADGQRASGLQFNVSHSGSWLAIVLARDLDVGIDIELERCLNRAADLGRRYFSDAEAEHLAALDEPERSRRFLTLWTVREACIKAMGSSLAAALGGLVLDPLSERIQRVPAGWPGSDEWSVLEPATKLPLTVRVAAPRLGLRLETVLLNCRAV